MSGHRVADNEPERAGSPLDRLLDLSVFAPLGFLLERNTVIDELAQKGRRQIAFSRSLGRAALRTIVRGAGSRPTGPAAGSEPIDSRAEAPVSSDRAVDGYDGLTARQVIEIVGQCPAAQLDWIRTTESQGKNRVTVLRALDRRADRRG